MTPFLLLQHDKWFNQMFPVCIRTTLVSKICSSFPLAWEMSHTDPHQTTNISQHVPPLMTINVNSAHPFVHTYKKLPHTKPLLLEWRLIFSIDVHFFSQYIQSRCILQYFLETYYYFWVLLSSLKLFKMFFMVFPQKPQFRPNKRLARLPVH